MNKGNIVKNTRLRFTYEDDVALLKEFLSINPTVHPQGWETIQQHLSITTGKDFLIRTLKQHIMLLIEVWLKKVKVDQIRSGVEEPQSERDALLQEVHSLCQENNYAFKEKMPSLSKNQQICNLGKKIRENYALASFCGNLEESEMSMTDTYSECATLPLDPTNDHDHDYAVAVGPIEDIPTEITTEGNSFVENLGTPAQPSTLPPPTPAGINSKCGETPPSKENNKILGPSRKRIHRKEPIRKNALAYLTDKHDKEAKIRIMELD